MDKSSEKSLIFEADQEDYSYSKVKIVKKDRIRIEGFDINSIQVEDDDLDTENDENNIMNRSVDRLSDSDEDQPSLQPDKKKAPGNKEKPENYKEILLALTGIIKENDGPRTTNGIFNKTKGFFGL